MVLRDAAVSPEVLLIERHSDSEFLPDLYVFPGGRVEDQDHAMVDRLTGLDAETAAALLGEEAAVATDLALGFFVAAIRETFEEAGVVLARRRGARELLDAASAAALAHHRLEVQDGSVSFREIVEKEDLELAVDHLAVHANWITPEMVPRRFDTFFFAALAPPGQVARHDGVEATEHVWLRPEEALEQFRTGERRIIFPTACNLDTLSGFETACDALEASHRRRVVPVLPRPIEVDGERKLVIREDAGYSRVEEFLKPVTR
jgi:8-oxo-dGTP pyrophosphatase MutT (NUDIX family)